jgi:uncharacterized spore protein YtfJ
MDHVENLVKTSLEEIERVLSTKTVVGEPITVEGNTIIPLIQVAFGFGAGGGSGTAEKQGKGEGSMGGSGGGAAIRPAGVIIIDKDGIRVEPILGSATGALEKIAEIAAGIIEKKMTK